MASLGTKPEGRFEGQVALVVGGASGIGAAVVAQLWREGCRVVHVADLDQESASHVARSVGGQHYEVDVSRSESVDRLFDRVREVSGRVDVVVHTAGIDDPHAKRRIFDAHAAGTDVDVLCELTDESWQRVMRVNLDGTFFVLRAAVRAMREGGRGAIVTVGSNAALDRTTGYPHYSASKAGVHALTQAVAKEAVAFGVRVNSVAPGLVDTPMADRTRALAGGQTEDHWGTAAAPEEIAECICFLASPNASNVIGAVLVSNGGLLTA
jgi:3-oxoacyl-[acyl-carrier protein] reductase